MKFLKFVVTSLFLLPLLSVAALQNFTIPSTTVGPDTISGTFTYDTSTNQISNPNIVVSGSVSKTYAFVGSNAQLPTYAVAQTAAVGTSGADQAIALFLSNLSANPPTAQFITFDCSMGLNNGLCINGSPNLTFTVTLSTPPATPAAIPTLSEWAMIFMASLMALFGIRRARRQ